MSIPQKINYVRKLEEDDDETMFVIVESSKNPKLFFRFANCNRII